MEKFFVNSLVLLGCIFNPLQANAFDLELYCRGSINWLGEGNDIVSLPWEDIVLITERRYKGRILEVKSAKIVHEHLKPDGKSVIYSFYLNRFTGEIHILDSTPKANFKPWVVTKGYCEKVTAETRKF